LGYAGKGKDEGGVASSEFVEKTKRFAPKAQTNLYVLAPPRSARTTNLAVFRISLIHK